MRVIDYLILLFQKKIKKRSTISNIFRITEYGKDYLQVRMVIGNRICQHYTIKIIDLETRVVEGELINLLEIGIQ